MSALALAACGAAESDAPAQAEGPLVQVVEVASASAAGAIRASGLVGYKREPQLSFTAPGIVGDLLVDAGDSVRRGQRLATLRRTSGGANVDEAALARANAERDLARTQELYDRGFVSEARLDDARLAVQRASDSSVLVAPADGVILRRAAETSQTVNAGTPILVFGETRSGIVVRAPVASSEASRIRVNDQVQVRVNELGVTRTGRVARVGAKGNDSTGAFEVEVEIADASGLRSGMVAEVEIAATPGAAATATLMVPTLSLLDARADQGIVFVVDAQGVARRRAVTTAGVTQAGVIVISGLEPGDRVISAGAAYVRDGETVRISAGT
ncbi:efflux RND transporter periplasmic adaptor subunit [Vitreimonas flagellata]|uniref:efflux RND transporter periplasmic adaptor subunit n=1 Tax=Vitreimonas flagellata TaxID=2560861 RepID=UPI001430DE66|nr:efflux RND transporter periplasmic adaptor subunit [Vitreimonas flagellata]